MMSNEEILNEVKNNFKLEGININKKQEDRIKKYLLGEVEFDVLINNLKEEYSKHNED